MSSLSKSWYVVNCFQMYGMCQGLCARSWWPRFSFKGTMLNCLIIIIIMVYEILPRRGWSFIPTLKIYGVPNCESTRNEPRDNILILMIFVPDSAFVLAGAGICSACPTKPHGGSHHAGDYGCTLGDGHAVLLLFYPQGNELCPILAIEWWVFLLRTIGVISGRIHGVSSWCGVLPWGRGSIF